MKKLVIMALYRSPLTVTLWPSSFLKKYGPMIPPADKAHQTVSVSGYGFSNETFLNGDSGVFMITPSDANYQHVVGAGAIASCLTCELRTIIEAVDLFETLPILEQIDVSSFSVTQVQLYRQF
ncbi:hypothetical protein TNCV_1323281 [Trichonephila clavipes]|nr:hypothetical protein TNCV_1323281 [Trichonephila clavipes]